MGADIAINGLEVEDVPGLIKEKTDGEPHSAVVTAVSKVASTRLLTQFVLVVAVAVGLPSENDGTQHRETVLDGIQVIVSLLNS